MKMLRLSCASCVAQKNRSCTSRGSGRVQHTNASLSLLPSPAQPGRHCTNILVIDPRVQTSLFPPESYFNILFIHRGKAGRSHPRLNQWMPSPSRWGIRPKRGAKTTEAFENPRGKPSSHLPSISLSRILFIPFNLNRSSSRRWS